MEASKTDQIKSIDIGNQGEAVMFRFETSQGTMHMGLPVDAARQVIALLEMACEKVESGAWKDDIQ